MTKFMKGQKVRVDFEPRIGIDDTLPAPLYGTVCYVQGPTIVDQMVDVTMLDGITRIAMASELTVISDKEFFLQKLKFKD